MNGKLTVALALITIGLLAAGCGQRGADGSGNREVSYDQADSLYKANCIACHAADLSGGVGPDLRQVGERLSESRIAEQILLGGDRMPPFRDRLTQAEIDGVSRWLADPK